MVYLIWLLCCFSLPLWASCLDKDSPVELWKQVHQLTDYTSCTPKELKEAKELLTDNYVGAVGLYGQDPSYVDVAVTIEVAMIKTSLIFLLAEEKRRGIDNGEWYKRGEKKCLDVTSPLPLHHQAFSVLNLNDCQDEDLEVVRRLMVRHITDNAMPYLKLKVDDEKIAQVLEAERTGEDSDEIREAREHSKLNSRATRGYVTALAVAKASLVLLPEEFGIYRSARIEPDCFLVRTSRSPFKYLHIFSDYSVCDVKSLEFMRDFLIKDIREFGKSYAIAKTQPRNQPYERVMVQLATTRISIHKISLYLIEKELGLQGVPLKALTPHPPLVELDEYGIPRAREFVPWLKASPMKLFPLMGEFQKPKVKASLRAQ